MTGYLLYIEVMNRSIRRRQLDRQVELLVSATRSGPSRGWIAAVREALGMSSRQLGRRLQITQQSAAELEQSERTGSITLKNLDRVARAMDAELFYAFVPRRSFDEIVREQAERLANQVVDRVETSMSLEDQATQPDSQRQRKLDLVNEYLRSTPRELWDQS